MHTSHVARSLVFGSLFLGTLSLAGCSENGVSAPDDEPTPVMGSLTVKTHVFGPGPDGSDFLSLVSVETGGTSNPDPQLVSAVDSAFFPNLLPGTYSIHVESQVADCTIDGGNQRGTRVHANLTTSEDFAALCPKSAATEIFKHLSEIEWASRFFLEDDGTFTLYYGSRCSDCRYPGAYSVQGDDYTFAFTTDAPTGAWEASAVRTDNCLAVDFNFRMEANDFRDGMYCQR